MNILYIRLFVMHQLEVVCNSINDRSDWWYIKSISQTNLFTWHLCFSSTQQTTRTDSAAMDWAMCKSVELDKSARLVHHKAVGKYSAELVV